MLALILSVSFSVAVSVFLKLAQRFRIAIDQAIAVNYVAAALLCFTLLRPSLGAAVNPGLAVGAILVLLGVLLPAVFLVMAAAVRQAGIVLSDTAQRLSLVLPLLAAFLVFQELLSGRKALGIAAALCALACLLRRPAGASAGTAPGNGRLAWLTLVGVWAGYGTIDILFKQMARLGAGFPAALLASFVLAAVLMLAWLRWGRRTAWDARSLACGVLLGALNFGNIYFYIRAHQGFPDNPTLVFAAMNIGVISAGILVGAGLFREALGRIQIVGIVLAVGAIVLLLPG